MRLPALLLLLLPAVALAQSEEDKQLLRLIEEEFEEQMRVSPLSASERGDRRYDDRLSDESAESREQRLEHARRRATAVRQLDDTKLSAANRTNRALLAYELARRIDDARFRGDQMPITQMWGPQNYLPQMASRISFTEPKHFDDYVSRLEQVPVLIDQIIANMREGMKAGRVPPRIVVAPTAGQARQHATEKLSEDPTLHAMYPPFKKGQESSPAAERARKAIKEKVVPAFAKLADFLEKEYIPACRESIAAADGLDGLAYYESRLRNHTTLNLTADEIHATGVREVKRIRDEMAALLKKHDLPHKDDFAKFTEFLRTDPQFYFTEKEDLLEGYRSICKRIDANMPKFFGLLPRLPYGVREMSKFIAPQSPTAYYYSGSLKNGIPGYFVANTFRLDQRPKYEMVALTLHEAVPGHHHQNAIRQEATGVPEWRTTLGYTAFGEGWALYCERLGAEMKGVYRTPYDHFGRLSYEMWRAMRLVVDTGMHAKGWSRDRAVKFMIDNSALTRQNIEREVDRYISWPGQATAYKIGEILIRRLRKKAEDELGPKFDIRGFHDTILSEGSIPLPLLEERINKWIEMKATEK
ncbi:MAG: DUF885 domain-containing protein [Planctomycetota bacterium]|jgi:uncharacterized protein (DUF885 family)